MQTTAVGVWTWFTDSVFQVADINSTPPLTLVFQQIIRTFLFRIFNLFLDICLNINLEKM